MTSIRLATIAVLGLTALSVGQARCQVVIRQGVGAPPPGPTVSPFINLLRTGNSPAANYYGLVRPQLQTNAGLQSLQQQILSAPGRPFIGPESADDTLVTGHAAVFMNLSGYFQSTTGGIAGQRPQLTGGAQSPSPGSRTPAVRR
jgi:hypothetical protein